MKGSYCGLVGRAVVSKSRGLWFESSHMQKFILNIYCQLYLKDENKEKEAWIGLFEKQNLNEICNRVENAEWRHFISD